MSAFNKSDIHRSSVMIKGLTFDANGNLTSSGN